MTKFKKWMVTMALAAVAMTTVIPVQARMSEEGRVGAGGVHKVAGISSYYASPLTQEASWQSSSGGRNMHTKVTMQRSGPLAGQIDVVTRTKNNVLFTGFTGGVFILLRHESGAVIGVSDLKQFGVDGKWIGRYDRTDYWSWSVSPEVAAATASIEIVQQHAARDLNDKIAYWQSVVCGNLDRLGIPKPPFGCGR